MELSSKKCSKCADVKPLDGFHIGDCAGGRQSGSKTCATAIMRKWRENNREKSNQISRRSALKRRDHRNAYHRNYYKNNRDAQLQSRRDYLTQLKAEAYAAYGGYKCACCGETEPRFLSLDHVNNDGNKHRKAIGGGSLIYRWLKVNGYPDTFQVLCMNCNFGKRMNNGVCPHVEAIYGITITEVR